MIKVVALILVFADGYMGGHTTGAYFYDMERCQAEGAKAVVRLTGYGHPTSFACAPTTLPEKFAKVVHQ